MIHFWDYQKIGGEYGVGAFAKDRAPVIQNTILFVGLFQDTIPIYRQMAKPLAMVHIDCDIYSATKTIFDELNDYIVKDTLLVFDEWVYLDKFGNKQTDGEQQGCLEWVLKNGREIERFVFSEPDCPLGWESATFIVRK